MPTPTKGARLGGSAAHQKIILANLATQLFEHGRITTTEAKARRLRPLAEKLITKAKRGDIHSRRLVLTTVKDKGVVHVLFTEIAPTFADREGGYTRITKVGPRKGDNAPMAVIELVTESVEDSKKANATVGDAGPEGSGQEGGGQDARLPPRRPARRSEESPAEELVSDTEERDESTSEQETPSDDTSAEEAAAVETPADPEPTTGATRTTRPDPYARTAPTFGWAPFLRSRSIAHRAALHLRKVAR